MSLPTFGEAFKEINDLAKERGFYRQLIQSYAVPGVNGEPLYTSYFHNFFQEDKKIKKAIVVISGVHGIEGFPGHALQCHILREKLDLALPSDTGLVLLHLVNPWGFSFKRRVNENNVDVNRGCFDREHGSNLLYCGVKKLVEPKELNQYTLGVIGDMVSNPEDCRKIFGATVSGQYHSPEGIFYGGKTTCQNGCFLYSECQYGFLSGIKKIVVVDIHTGLGPYGVGSILCALPSKEDKEAEKVLKMFGPAVQFPNAGKQSVAVGVYGDVLSAMKRWLPKKCDYTGVALEMGTTSPVDSFPAIVAENWLYHHPKKAKKCDPELVKKVTEMYYKTFAPLDDQVWMEKFYASFLGLWKSVVQEFSE